MKKLLTAALCALALALLTAVVGCDTDAPAVDTGDTTVTEAEATEISTQPATEPETTCEETVAGEETTTTAETAIETTVGETTEAETTADPAAELAATLRENESLRAQCKKIATVPNDGVSTVSQGGYTDGKYHYQLFIKKDTENDEENNIVRLMKYDLESGETVQISDPLPLNHANDLTYNAKRGVFVAVHNNPHRKWVSLIDPETLTVTETIKLDVKIYSIAYNEARDQYVVGLSGGQTFRFLDADFQPVDDVVYQPTELTVGYTTQGAACDENFIYFVLYNQNVITVYDWDGNFVSLITLTVEGEPENLNVVDGTIYVACGVGGGTAVYEIMRLRAQ